MKKYSKTTGGFYAYEIHGANMPADVVDVPEDQYAALLEAQSAGKVITADANGFPVAVARVVTLAEIKTAKINEINRAAQKFVDALTKDYPAFEIETWPRQEAEARAWKADPTAATPYVDRLAARRNIPRETYLQKTYEKVVAFEITFDVVGDRQYFVDLVNAIGNTDNATNRNQVAAIAPVFPRPA